jgi:hypothetical protein
MKTSSRSSTWKECYSAALFQDDATQLPSMIARAESEIVKRARLLSEASGDNANELRTLNYSLRMLQMLKRCALTNTSPHSTIA